MEQRVFYLCDGEKKDCKRTNCYKNGGECKHTEDVEHAKNFHRDGIDSEKSSFFESETNEKTVVKGKIIFEGGKGFIEETNKIRSSIKATKEEAKIYTELITIRRELQAIRNDLERAQSFRSPESDCNDLVIKDIQGLKVESTCASI